MQFPRLIVCKTRLQWDKNREEKIIFQCSAFNIVINLKEKLCIIVYGACALLQVYLSHYKFIISLENYFWEVTSKLRFSLSKQLFNDFNDYLNR